MSNPTQQRNCRHRIATAQRQTQINRIRDEARKVRRAADELKQAADELEYKIETTNRLFDDLERKIQDTDRYYAGLVQQTRDKLADYIVRMRNLRNSFDVPDYYTSFLESEFALRDPGGLGGGNRQMLITDILSNEAELDALHAYIDAVLALKRLSDVDSVNTLRGALSALEFKDKAGIINVVVDAPEVPRDMFMGFVGYLDIVVGSFDAFHLTTGRLWFNPERDRNNPKGAYWTFFHEAFHMIDWALHSQQGELKTRGSEFTQRLYDAIRQDVEAQLRQLAASIPVDFEVVSGAFPNQHAPWMQGGLQSANAIREAAIENILAGRVVVSSDNRTNAAGANLSPVESLQLQLQNMAIAMVEGNLHQHKTPYNMITVLDAFAGASNGAVGSTHFGGRPPDYWYRPIGNPIHPTHNQNSETFANHMANWMLNNETAMQNDKDLMPNAMGVVDEIVDSILGGIR